MWFVLARDEESGKVTKGTIVAAITLPWHVYDLYLIEVQDPNPRHVEVRTWLYMADTEEGGRRIANFIKNERKLRSIDTRN